VTNDVDLRDRIRDLPRRATRYNMPQPGPLEFYPWTPLGTGPVWEEQVKLDVRIQMEFVHRLTLVAVNQVVIQIRSTVRPTGRYCLFKLEGGK